MSLYVASININGIRDNKKRNCIFHWLIKQKYDLVCLQETHCTEQSVYKWEKEWKNSGGGESIWNCGSSDSRGVCILLRKNFQYKFTEKFRDNYGRTINIEIDTGEIKILLKCIYSPNDGGERKRFF